MRLKMTENHKMLFLVSLWINGSWGIITVDQTPPVISVQPGDNVQILCRASQDIGNDMSLHQFKSGQAPKGLMYYSASRFSHTPGRFSGTYTGALTTFTITGVQVEDEAQYYCQQGEERPYMFGQGTRLTVKSRATAVPQVGVFAPTVKDPVRAGDQTMLLCLINNFYPDQVSVSWTMDGKDASGVKHDSQSVRSPDGTYSKSSTLTLSSSTWESGQNYVCRVQHESQSEPVTGTLVRNQCQMK